MVLIWNVLFFLLALSLLVIAHECGHFFVARYCGVFVEQFVLGLGKPLLRTVDRRGTSYALAPIPLGGYIKMLDERHEVVKPELKHAAFNNKTSWQRFLIVIAGPVANILLALCCYWLLFFFCTPTSHPVIASIVPHSIAAKAGFTPGMRIVSIEGTNTPDWEKVVACLTTHAKQSKITVETVVHHSSATYRNKLILCNANSSLYKFNMLVALGILPQNKHILPIIQHIDPNSAAATAKLQVGDNIIQLNGKPIEDWSQLVAHVRTHLDKKINLLIERQGKQHVVVLTPQKRYLDDGQVVGYVGITPKFDLSCARCGLLKSFLCAASKTWQVTQSIATTVIQLFSGKLGFKNLSGPVSIAKTAGHAASRGILFFLNFLAVLSINLGIINLIPIPVLDGGQALFLLFEMLKGRPISQNTQEVSYKISVLLLIILTCIALFNDICRL